MAELVAKRYAEALFEAAVELDKLDGLKEEMVFVSEVFNFDAKLKTVFEHPKLSKSEKKDIVNSLFEEKVSQEMKNLLYILVDKRREKHIDGIRNEFVGMYNKEKNIVEATALTRIPMTEDEVKKLTDKLASKLGKHVSIKNTVDVNLIGGMLIRIEDKVVDLSIKGQLEGLQKMLNSVKAK